MRTASIRDVRHDFSRVLAWVADGEEVAITKRRETVARLLPVTRRKTTGAKMPDITRRLRKVFGDKVLSDKAMRGLFDDLRGDY
jgi:prevent-host-death family protein